jgi:hypothetical protein
MHPILRNILAVLAGAFIGGVVNMALVVTGPMLITPPEGADITTMEGLSATIHLFEPKHFLFPFLAHALGTLVGAFLTVKLAVGKTFIPGMIIGVFFLVGGAMNIVQLPGSPMWFNVLDLIAAYIPMAWIGVKLAK